LAVLADIHGNIRALEAVLADARRREVGGWLNLGDTLYGPLEPGATADCLMQETATSIRGNQDRLLLSAGQAATGTMAHCRAELTPGRREWLDSHPATAVAEGVFLCHGTPRRDDEYLLEDPPIHGSRLKQPEEIAKQIADVRAPVIVCGHSHLPREIRLPDGRLIVNPGSVGLPAYAGDDPPHGMENGSPHARYAVLTAGAGGWTVEQIAVPYDWEAASRTARENGREDWARWLATGRV
jgi:diadenosine tetraphosphatase ApaH/serine/threonine PP2A family protein phosphatase